MGYVGTKFGLLLVDKPEDMTSHDVVNKARNVLKTKAIGHAGTLDPFATGLLVLAIGRATKLMPYLSNHDKTYEATMIFGRETDTLDPTGSVVAEKNCEDLDKETILKAFNHFNGAYIQETPAYSAVKVAGRKLYEYQRKGLETPETPKREIIIYGFENILVKNSESGKIQVSFVVKVSKGTYIRQLAKDLGSYLHYPASLISLKRIASGPYQLKDATSYDNFIKGHFNLIDPLENLGLGKIVVTSEITKKVENGAFIDPEYFQDHDDTIIYDETDKPLAIYRFDPERKVMRMTVKLL